MRSLSAEDRALIDAAIAEGRVKKIETGTWTLPIRVQGGRHAAYRLIQPGVPIEECPVLCRRTHQEIAAPVRKKREARAAASARRGSTRYAESRRAQYRDMIHRKLTVEQMASEAGVTVGRIRQVLREMGVDQSDRASCADLRPEYERLLAAGASVAEIAKAVGRGKTTVRDHLDQLGLRTPGWRS